MTGMWVLGTAIVCLFVGYQAHVSVMWWHKTKRNLHTSMRYFKPLFLGFLAIVIVLYFLIHAAGFDV